VRDGRGEGLLPDTAVEAYVEAIEAHLRARRGVDHMLSPRDFAQARSWHHAGVPLATVLVGIDRAFESGADVASLAFCRRRVEDLVAAGPRPTARPSPASEAVPLEEVARILGLLLEHLARLRAATGAFEPPLRKIREVQDLLAVATRPNFDYLRIKLREIDDDVSAAALQALGPEELDLLRAEAGRAVERHRGRVDDDALEDARGRYTLQRARERFDLPRVCLI
jgi:hypothetical protein